MTYSATTKIIQVDPLQPDPEAIAEAAQILRSGGLVAFPTETVYGLGANALSAEAISHIFAAKERPASDPLIAHITGMGQLDQLAMNLPPLTNQLAAEFWPGPLTLVLTRHPSVPANLSAGRDTVAVRMPAHPVAQQLISAADTPIAAPSANLFSRPSPTTAQHVLTDLRGRVDLILDGGATPVGVESTVLDLTQNPPVVLRPGGVSVEALREFIPDVRHTPRYLKEGDSVTAPGMLLKHYAPSAELWLFTGTNVFPAMHGQIAACLKMGQSIGVLTVDEDRDQFDGLSAELISLGSINNLEQIAQNLFAGLRQLDEHNVDVIFARGFSQEGLGLALQDRLTRAAEGRVIHIDDADMTR